MIGVTLLWLVGLKLAASLDEADVCLLTTSSSTGKRGDYEPGEDGSYAQNYQDTWVASLAKHNAWTDGFFLDLGAFHGTQCSNTAFLERSLNWNGICVEPMPEGFESRRCMLVSRALSDVGGQDVQLQGSGQRRSIALLQKPTRTITARQLLDCASLDATAPVPLGADCTGVGQLKVPNFINFVSLDIEGHEISVLTTFPWDKFQVGAWIVENAVDAGRTAEKQAAVREVLRQHGYVAAPVRNAGVDEYFVLPQFWDPSLAEKEMRVHPPGSSGC